MARRKCAHDLSADVDVAMIVSDSRFELPLYSCYHDRLRPCVSISHTSSLRYPNISLSLFCFFMID